VPVRWVAFILVACGGAPSAADSRPPTAPPPGALIDLAAIAPDIQVDIRYATDANFTHQVLYPRGRCLLRREVAQRLARVQRALRGQRLGLRVWDCYRPFAIQKLMWKLVPDERYVARPVERNGRPVQGSKHNRGAAVDLTLVGADGEPLPMPTPYDDFTRAAHRASPGGTPAARANARRLERAMRAAGFEPMPTEWWHFDAPTWRRYPLTDTPIE
jgi:beta-N-acetylhexosaminidase/D-alanyl-D-alanine dipeptidase